MSNATRNTAGRKRRLGLLSLLLVFGCSVSGMAQAGQWLSKTSWDWLWGIRDYNVYIPDGYTPGQPMPLVLGLHGCLQNPSQFAGASRLNQKADQEGFIVVYPNQATWANPSQCWNFMLTINQSRGSGEPAAVMKMVNWVRSHYSVDSHHMYVMGVSAGAALTSIMMACYPDVFAAGAVEAGPMYKAAVGPITAAAAMLVSSPYDPNQRGYDAWSCGGKRHLLTPVIVFQGNSDIVVNPRNADQVTQQFLQTSDYADDGYDNNTVAYSPTSSWQGAVPGGHTYTVKQYNYDGQTLAIQYNVDGMNHAISGGDESYLFTDADGPDSTSIIWNFFKSKHR